MIKFQKRHVYKIDDVLEKPRKSGGSRQPFLGQPIKVGEPVEAEDEREHNPWFAGRAIRYWLYKAIARAPYTIGNIDDHDGEQNYKEEQLELLSERRGDDRIDPEDSQILRASLIHCENELDEVLGGEIHLRTDGAWTAHVMRVMRAFDGREMWPHCSKHLGVSRRRMVKTDVDAERTRECEEPGGHKNTDSHTSQTITRDPAGEGIRVCKVNIRRAICRDDVDGAPGVRENEDHEELELIKWLDCMLNGSKRQMAMARHRDEDFEGDELHQIRNMIGQSWGQLPHPIAIESGVCASVMPTQWCSHVQLKRTQQSSAGEFFNAANWQRICNEGNRTITMMTSEGAMRDMNFTACGVSRALGSVSQKCRVGHGLRSTPLRGSRWILQ